MLFTKGIPIGKGRDMGGLENIMPSMAPVLQRVSIEIKQTFRFASSLQRSPSKLVICGPGAAIPKIGAALAQSLDLHIDTDPKAKDYLPQELFGFGSSEHTVACEFGLDIELLPKVAKEIRTRSMLNRSVKVGACAVAAFIGGQYFYATQQSNAIGQVVAQQSATIDQIELDGKRRDSIRILAGTIGSAAMLFEESMGRHVDWTGVLNKMPNDDHDHIQISELQCRMNSSKPMMNVSGMAVASDADDQDASQVLSQYIKKIREIDKVKQIQIGSTSRTQIDESTWGLNFVLSVEIETERGHFSDLTMLSEAGEGVQP
jgi:hypothetical protein